MSNTDSSELNHTTEVTLIVPCGNHEEAVKVQNYPIKWDRNAIIAPLLDNSFPTPCCIEFHSDGSTSRTALFHRDYVTQRLNSMLECMKTILQAGIVNDKQRKALEDIVKKNFNDEISKLYD